MKSVAKRAEPWSAVFIFPGLVHGAWAAAKERKEHKENTHVAIGELAESWSARQSFAPSSQ